MNIEGHGVYYKCTANVLLKLESLDDIYTESPFLLRHCCGSIFLATTSRAKEMAAMMEHHIFMDSLHRKIWDAPHKKLQNKDQSFLKQR